MTFAQLPAVSRNPMIALITACGLLLLQTPASADVFKWVNENNEVQYTQMQPPAGTDYIRIKTTEHPEVIEAQSKPKPEAEAATGTGAEEKIPQAKQQTDAEDQAAYEAEVARVSEHNCKVAHNNLSQLNIGGRLRYRNEAGEYVTMTEEERQQRIAEAKSQIELYCKDKAK